MLSSVCNNSFAFRQTGHSQRSSAIPTDGPDQGITKSAALKTVVTEPTGNKKIGGLSESDLKVISELKQKDTEVRVHEAAHLAAAGGIATSGATFSYQQGPDGARYAIGGEVSIDTSSVTGDPAATLQKADTIRRAALAPAQPSGPDMQAAASATAMAAQARAELFQKNQDSHNGDKAHLGSKIDLAA